MLITQGAARSADADRRLACVLAGVAGALNAAVFRAVGFFAANMTGNVSRLSDQLALGVWRPAAFLLAIVALFVGGAAISTLIIGAGRRRQLRGIYALTILIEALLLALLGGVVLNVAPATRTPALVLGLSVLMGLQNAVVTRISEARVRTTHVSGMVTDIGIELAVLFDILRSREPAAGARTNRSQLRLHGQTVAAFFAGGIGGALMYGWVGVLTLFAAALVLLLIAANALWRARTVA